MKPKILFILAAVLIIVTLISFLITKESVRIQPVLQPQQTAAQQAGMLLGQTKQLPSHFENKPAITIIRPHPEENLSLAEEKMKASRRLPGVSNERTDALSDEPAPDIKKSGKFPTEQENKEMNTRGIVTW